MANLQALVLHDDARTVALVRSIVSAEGLDVVAAESPYRLLEVPQDPAPALVAIGLAALDDRDLDLFGVLRRRWPHTTVLVLFPAVLRERAARCLDLGADGYLPEPFYPGELAALARVAAGRAAPPATPAAPLTAAEGAAAAPSAASAPHAADEALTKLAAGIAHSVRNPLQILELQLGSYESDGSLDVAGLREQLARIATVAESLTRFSGRRKLSMRTVDVNAMVQRAFEAPSRVQHAARLDLSPKPLDVLGAPDLLLAAVETVCERARRVTPEGGEIVATTSLVEERGGERFAEITVEDGGPALAPAQLAAVFDPFPEADRVAEGTGMEMAAAAGIVRNHGGRVAARAGAGAGTTVVMRLPLRKRGAVRGVEGA